jgi:hypothetical protein
MKNFLSLLLNQKTKEHEKIIQTFSLRVFNYRFDSDADRNYPWNCSFPVIYDPAFDVVFFIY